MQAAIDHMVTKEHNFSKSFFTKMVELPTCHSLLTSQLRIIVVVQQTCIPTF